MQKLRQSEEEKRIPHRKNSKQKEPKKEKKKNFKLTTIHRDGYSRKHQNAFHASKHPL